LVDLTLAMRGAGILMRNRVLRILLATAILAAYPLASLSPFHPLHWGFPTEVANGAELLPQGGIIFPTPGVVRSVSPPDWVAAAIRSERLELTLRVQTFSADQRGPARIFTLSADPYRRDLTIGQEGEDLILRLRTPGADINGTRAHDQPVAELPGVFRTPATWVEIHLAIEPGRLRLSADAPESGHRVGLDTALAAQPLRDWDPFYRLGLGNELTSDRAWLGEIQQALVRADGNAIDYAAPDARGTLEVSPARFWSTRQTFTVMPFRDFMLEDAFINVVGYVPLGLLFGVWGWLWGGERRSWSRTVALLLAIAAVSATLETLQFLIPVRHPSTTDLLLNTLGGGIGLLLVEWARAAGLEISLQR
jgi:VanZ family protein